MDSATRRPVDGDELADALRRVSADPVFVRSPQLRRLLDYLVKCAIAGECHPKEYTIAVEALGRSCDFDPDRDAIVRVQAGRLRRALDKYYAAAGRDDAVRIVLANGGYMVCGERQRTADETPPPPPAGAWRLRAAVVATAAAVIVAAVMAPAFRHTPIVALSIAPAEQPGNGLPTIVIEPFAGPGSPADDVPVLNGLRRKIAAAFAQFETVNVVYVPRTEAAAPVAPPRPASARVYSLAATLAPADDGPRVLFQLTDLIDRTVVWAKTFELPRADDVAAGRETIVRTLATTLLPPFGVVLSRERASHLRGSGGDPRWRCVLEAMDALRDATEDGYRNAHACLTRVVDSDPRHTLAQSYLALILNRYFQHDLADQPNALAAALETARRAIQTNPASARAHFALFVTRFNMRAFDAADAAMAQARALNDYDLVMRSEYGGRLVAAGRVDDGMAILDAVDHPFTARTCSHGFYIFLGHYVRGDWPAAQRRADEFTCPAFGFAYLARALVALRTGDREAARTALESVAALLPGWRADPRTTLGRTIPDTAIVDGILRDLAAVEVATSN